MGITNIPYTAKGHAGVVDAVAPIQFWLDAAGQPIFENWVIAAGQVLPAYTVLGVVTASNELVECDPGAADGSQTPFAVLMEDLDTSATGLNAATEVGVLTGSGSRMINYNALVANAAWGKNDLRRELGKAGFATRTPIYSAL
ncbi:head decoration protein [Sulfitobacter sp. 1A15106]|uniref:head decoration protein n=1 Tax=Sulfitobacter sp. 1A15106 TaxID=3368590 RepID=UPI003745E2CE